MLTALWGRITGKDKRLAYPNQQASFLGRLGDYTIVYPYGLYCDLEDNRILKEIGHGVAIPMTVTRPADAARGEVALFHPPTNTRIIARNNGDLDIDTTDKGGNVNINTVSANVTASNSVNVDTDTVSVVAATSVTIDTPASTFMGNVQIDGNLNVTRNITSLANVIATALLEGATLTVSGAGSINGKDFITHYHTQGVDSRGDTQANTSGVA